MRNSWPKPQRSNLPYQKWSREYVVNILTMEQDNQTKEELSIVELESISSFFDLLARFDYEDNQNKKLVHDSDSLVSAPRGSEFSPNSIE